MDEAGANSPDAEKKERAGCPEFMCADALIGQIFDKRYEILARFGSGATGTVYKAYDNLLQRNVALKIIHSQLIFSQQAVERFRNESSISTALSHPNIARVYAQAVANDGRLYMVMDCLAGENLAQIILRDGKMDFDSFFEVFAQIIDALKYAHAEGVIHRDIKPSNIVVTRDDGSTKALLVDFGLAKWLDASHDQGTTHTAALLGSSAYMSPELCLPSGKADQRSDIYSLGCVMLESLAGHSPFQGESALDVMYKHLNESLRKLKFLKELPESMSGLIEKCLQKNPERRYQTLRELKTDFDKYYEGQDTLKRRWLLQRTMVKFSGTTIVLVVLLLLAICGLGSVSLYKTNKQRSEFYGLQRPGSEKDLEPPETVRLPLLDHDVTLYIDRYKKKMGDGAVIKLLNNWERQHGHQAEPSNHAIILGTLVRSYISMDEPLQAEACAKRIFALNLAKPSAHAASSLASMYIKLGEPEKGLIQIDKVMSKFPEEMLQIDDQSALLCQKALCLMDMRKYSAALPLLQRLRHRSIELELEDYADDWRTSLLMCLSRTNQKVQLKNFIKEWLQQGKAACAEQKDALASVYDCISSVFCEVGEYEESLKFLESAKDAYKKIGDSEKVAYMEDRAASCYTSLHQYDKAKAIYTLLLKHEATWPDNVLCLLQISNLAKRTDELPTWIDNSKQALQRCDKHLLVEQGDLCRHADDAYLGAIRQFSGILNDLGKDAENENLLNVWSDKVKAKAGDSLLLANLYDVKGHFLAEQRRYKEALDCADKEMAILSNPQLQAHCRLHNTKPNESMSNAYALKVYVFGYTDRPVQAAEAARQSLELWTKPSLERIGLLLKRAECLTTIGKIEQAKECLAQVEPLYRHLFSSGKVTGAEYLRELARLDVDTQQCEKAEKILQECIADISKDQSSDRDSLPDLYVDLGKLLLSQKKFAESFGCFRQAATIIQDTDTKNAHALSKIDEQRISLLESKLAEVRKSKQPNPTDVCDQELALHSAYLNDRQLPQAEREAEAALKTASSIPVSPSLTREKYMDKAFLGLGMVQLQEGKNSEAEENLRQSGRLNEVLKSKTNQPKQ